MATVWASRHTASTGGGTGRPASRATIVTITALATSGVASWANVAGPRAARGADNRAPIQATNVPSIHQIGRYHHVEPPPTASQGQGDAWNGRRMTMSIAEKNNVPTQPPPP